MRRRLPGQLRLLGAGAMMVVGGFLPWIYTYVGSVSGAVGAGLWVFYVGLLAVAGGLLPPRLRPLIIGQAVLSAAVALALSAWQVVRFVNLYREVGSEGWLPGPGLVLSTFGGILALLAVRQLAAAARPRD